MKENIATLLIIFALLVIITEVPKIVDKPTQDSRIGITQGIKNNNDNDKSYPVTHNEGEEFETETGRAISVENKTKSVTKEGSMEREDSIREVEKASKEVKTTENPVKRLSGTVRNLFVGNENPQTATQDVKIIIKDGHRGMNGFKGDIVGFNSQGVIMNEVSGAVSNVVKLGDGNAEARIALTKEEYEYIKDYLVSGEYIVSGLPSKDPDYIETYTIREFETDIYNEITVGEEIYINYHDRIGLRNFIKTEATSVFIDPFKDKLIVKASVEARDIDLFDLYMINGGSYTVSKQP